MHSLKLVRSDRAEPPGAPIPSVIRLGLQFPGMGLAMVCETPPDVDSALVGWRLLRDQPTSAIVAQCIDEFGHLIDTRRVSASGVTNVFGEAVRDVVVARLAAHGLAA